MLRIVSIRRRRSRVLWLPAVPLLVLAQLLALPACEESESPTSPGEESCPPVTPGYTYYIYAHLNTDPAVQEAYRNGFLTVAVDYGLAPGAYRSDPWAYQYVLKYELTHVFQFTLTNCPSNQACPTWLDVWFREGQAVVTGGGYRRPTLQSLDAWRAHPDHINPISISRWWNFPDEDRGGEFYPIFALTYAWLMDAEGGHGSTIQDMKAMFQFMAEGDSFHDAFERALGISVAYLEENFFTLMEAYLAE